MAREFKETAHTKTDMNKYGDNYDHIFKKPLEHKPLIYPSFLLMLRKILQYKSKKSKSQK
jgi:hypothetical protein